MAINIVSSFHYNMELYLDERQNIASSLSSLANWSNTDYLPDGFELYYKGDWYVYNSGNTADSSTGLFRLREEKLNTYIETNDSNIATATAELKAVDTALANTIAALDTKTSTNLSTAQTEIYAALESAENDLSTDIESLKAEIAARFGNLAADKYSDLTSSSSWEGLGYIFPGMLVSVVSDTVSNNGTYRLTSTAYSSTANWVKLVDTTDLISSGDNNATASSNTKIYTSARTDEKFVRSDISQTITSDWTFEKNVNIEGNTTVGGDVEVGGNATVGIITAESSDIKDLPKHIFDNVNIGVDNLLLNTSFAGNYQDAEVSGTDIMTEVTELYSATYENWSMTGSWSVTEDSRSVSGYCINLSEGTTLTQSISQTVESLITDDWYVLSFKAEGTITATIDGNTITSTVASSGGYVFTYILFQFSGTYPVSVVFTGSGNLCEPKLERGTVSSGWYPATSDTDPVASLIYTYNYLKQGLTELDGAGAALGIVLKSIIQGGTGDTNDPDILGGINGICGSTSSVFTWASSTLDKAIAMAGKLESSPNYCPTEEELQDITTYLVTWGGTAFFAKARGRFRGYFETSHSGTRVVLDPDENDLKIISGTGDTTYFRLRYDSGKIIMSAAYFPTSTIGLDDGDIYLEEDENGNYTLKAYHYEIPPIIS